MQFKFFAIIGLKVGAMGVALIVSVGFQTPCDLMVNEGHTKGVQLHMSFT